MCHDSHTNSKKNLSLLVNGGASLLGQLAHQLVLGVSVPVVRFRGLTSLGALRGGGFGVLASLAAVGVVSVVR